MPTGLITEAVGHDQVTEVPRPPQQGLLGPRLCLRAPPEPGPVLWAPQLPMHPPSSVPKDSGQEPCSAIFPLKMRLESRLFCRFRKKRRILWVHLGSSFLPTKCHTEDGDTGGSPSPRSAHQHWHLCGPWCPKALSRPEVVEPGRGSCFPGAWSRAHPGPSGLCFGAQPPGPSWAHPEMCPRPGVLAPRGPPTPSQGRGLCPARPAVPLRAGLGHQLRGPGPVLPSGRHPERAQREDVEGHRRQPGGRPLALRQLLRPPQVTGGGLSGPGWAGGAGGGRRAPGPSRGDPQPWGLLTSWAGVLLGPRASAARGRRKRAAQRGQGVRPHGAWGRPERGWPLVSKPQGLGEERLPFPGCSGPVSEESGKEGAGSLSRR